MAWICMAGSCMAGGNIGVCCMFWVSLSGICMGFH